MSRLCELSPPYDVRTLLEILMTAASLLATGFLLLVLAFCV